MVVFAVVAKTSFDVKCIVRLRLSEEVSFSTPAGAYQRVCQRFKESQVPHCDDQRLAVWNVSLLALGVVATHHSTRTDPVCTACLGGTRLDVTLRTL